MVLNWTNPLDPDFDHIEIWYSTNDMPLLRFQGTIDPAGTALSGLDNGTIYSFTVKTVDSAENTSEGMVIQSTPVDTQGPTKIAVLESSAGDG